MIDKFESILIIGMGLMGSSLAKAMYSKQLANNIYGVDKDPEIIKKCHEMNLVVKIENDISKFDIQFDFIIIATPLSTYKDIFLALNNYVKKPTFLT